MTELDRKQESGVAFITEVMGEAYGGAFRDAAVADRFGSHVVRMAATSAFHDAWRHENISRRDKSVTIISALIAMRQFAEVKVHVKIGLANGLTAAELEGILVQLVPYVGFPCVTSATAAIVEALRESGASPSELETPEERGLV